MLHRAIRSVAITLFVLGILIPGNPGTSDSATAPANDVSIRFDEIESFMRANSPRARIIAQEIAAVAAERDQALQWSNPTVAYDHEENDLFREWQVTLHKRIEMPFSRSSLKDGWRDRVRAAELQGVQESEDLLAELKAGYVRLQLVETYLVRLTRLAELVDMASTVASSKYSEGELSGTDKQLIQLAAFSLDAMSRRVRLEHSRATASWRAEMNLPAAVAMDLTTRVEFQPFELDDSNEYAAALSHRPGNQSRVALSRSLGNQAEANRPSLVPGIDVYGGYKSFEAQPDGFVAGVALDLPLFDRNAGAAKRYEAERLVIENRIAVSLARSREDLASLVVSIREVQPSLAAFSERLDRSPPLADALILSYREGSLSLDTLLGAIQIESTALEHYYDELVTYYMNIFRLEAITGATIVRFAS